MKNKFRYEPPMLVNMKGPSLCGEFLSCSSGGLQYVGVSCAEETHCRSGSGAERCANGSSACGCDSCCETGSSWSSTSGFPFTGCECVWGNQARMHCSDGQWTGSVCTNGYYAGDGLCSVGSEVISGSQHWCASGA